MLSFVHHTVFIRRTPAGRLYLPCILEYYLLAFCATTGCLDGIGTYNEREDHRSNIEVLQLICS